MTTWTEQPLRKPGAAWPGINTKGGKLDNGTGQLTDNSVNCTINRADVLAKRTGFVRGLKERFPEVVCGLHRYTSNCGVEYLLVASSEEIAIRQPFVIPVFVQSDAYPQDNFSTVLSVIKWRNTTGYATASDRLVRTGSSPSLPFDRGAYLRWFKDASNTSYEVQIEYAFDSTLTTQQAVSIAIRGNGDLNTGAYLHCDLRFQGPSLYTLSVYRVDAGASRTLLASAAVSGRLVQPGGFLTLRYQRVLIAGVLHGKVSAQVVPIGGALQTLTGTPDLTEGQDRDLGLVSAIGCTQNASILVVSGGSL